MNLKNGALLGFTLKPGLAIARGKSKGKTESFDKEAPQSYDYVGC